MGSRPFSSYPHHWRKFALPYQALMKTQLERIAKQEGLCKNVYEIVNQSL